MENLKNNGEELIKDVEHIIQNYLKLFGLRQSESLASFMGLISSVILITTLLLIVILFCSFVLGDLLNDLFESNYLGYGIISGIYALIIIILLLRIKKKGAPLFANFYVKLILPLLKIETRQRKDLKGLSIESENVKENIELHKKTFMAHSQLLKYSVMEDFKNQIVDLVSSKLEKRKDRKNGM